MKFNKKTLIESLNISGGNKKSFTENKKQNVILSEDQFDRVLAIIQEQQAAIGDYVEGKGVYKGDDSSGNAIYSKKEEANETVKKSYEEGEEVEDEVVEAAKPDFLDLDKDGNKKESMKKAAKDMKEDSGHREAMDYGKDEGHDDKELYDLKHDGGSEYHIDDLEDDMNYDNIHDSEHIEESKEEKERLIREDIKKMKQIIKPLSKI